MYFFSCLTYAYMYDFTSYIYGVRTPLLFLILADMIPMFFNTSYIFILFYVPACINTTDYLKIHNRNSALVTNRQTTKI